MDLILEFSAIFMLGGTAGWICELFYRRLAHGRWINPGFLTGPCLPLYGTGATILYLIGNADININFTQNEFLRKAAVIVVITVVMTVIEYITGIIFTKKFHVWLWDYTKRWGNIQGVICPLFSAIWGLAGAAYYLYVHKYAVFAVEFISSEPIYTYFLGIYIGVFAVDAGYSFNLVSKIKAWAETKQLNVRFEHFKVVIRTHAEERRMKKHFVFSFRGIELRESLEYYGRMIKDRASEIKQKHGRQ